MTRQPEHLTTTNLRMVPFCDLIGWTLPQFLAARRALLAEYWPEDQPHFWLARRTDNDASQDAADAMRPRLPNIQLMLFVFMLLAPQPQLHEVAEEAFVQCGIKGQSTVRTRCSELEDLGLVERWGPKVPNRLGNAAYRYRIKPWVRRRAALVLATLGLDVPAYGDEGQEVGAEVSPAVSGPESRPMTAAGPEPLPLFSHEPPQRVAPLDEDTGSIKSWWSKDWLTR